MINAVIVDDEKKGRDLLEILLKENCPTVNIINKVGSVEDAFYNIIEKKPDLVFLDIEMPGGTGFDLLEKFDNINFSIIFVTAYDKYALKAFKFSAVDYLLKPVDEEELKTAVSKVIKKDYPPENNDFESLTYNYKSLKTDNRKLALDTSAGLVFVEIKNITHCEANGKSTWCYIHNQEKILAKKNLGEFENFLSDYNFIRVHHSHLVNVDFIKSYKPGRTGVITMQDNSLVDVSQRKKDDFLKKLNKI
jgi:two-component system LytT family response regulator